VGAWPPDAAWLMAVVVGGSWSGRMVVEMGDRGLVWPRRVVALPRCCAVTLPRAPWIRSLFLGPVLPWRHQARLDERPGEDSERRSCGEARCPWPPSFEDDARRPIAKSDLSVDQTSMVLYTILAVPCDTPTSKSSNGRACLSSGLILRSGLF
jgi:hypothetical protein